MASAPADRAWGSESRAAPPPDPLPRPAPQPLLLVSPAGWAGLPIEHRRGIEGLRATIARTLANHAAQKDLDRKRQRLAKDVRRYHAVRGRGEFDVALRTSIDDQDIRIREEVSRLDNSVRGLWNDLKGTERLAGLERAYAMREAEPRDAHVQVAGDPFDPGPLVRRGVPLQLAGGQQLEIPDGQSGRLELARWLTSPDNPLTPRVAVNYIWQFHFGKGIVSTSDDFGLGGSAPTHPELLDWLARQFIDNGWSVKHLHKSRQDQHQPPSQSTTTSNSESSFTCGGQVWDAPSHPCALYLYSL